MGDARAVMMNRKCEGVMMRQVTRHGRQPEVIPGVINWIIHMDQWNDTDKPGVVATPLIYLSLA